MENMKTREKKIVVLNKDFSKPRRVRKSSPLPPKPAPSEAPRCCKRIRTIDKIAEITVVV